MGLTLNPKQLRAWDMLVDPLKTKYTMAGGKRAGKTDVIVEFFLQRVFNYPTCKQLMARKTRVAIEESIWSGTLAKYFNKFIPPNLYDLNSSKLIAKFWNGSEIHLAGLDDKERVEKMWGNEFFTVYGNEGTQFSSDAILALFTLAAQSVPHKDTGIVGVPKTILDCNPRGPRHFMKKQYIDLIDPDTGARRRDFDKWGVIADWNPYDNIANLSKDYVETLEALPDVMRRRMVEGAWVDNEGAVYSDFDDDVHVCKQCSAKPGECPRAKEARQIVAGIDFGFVHPFVHLWVAEDGDGRLLVFDEHYKSGLINDEHAQAINSRKWRVSWRVTDHDPEAAATLRRKNIQSKLADKSSKSIEAGCDLVRERLKVQDDGKPRLQVCQYCESTIGEFYTYLMDEKKGKPVKEHDDAMDALRYIVVESDGKAHGSILVM